MNCLISPTLSLLNAALHHYHAHTCTLVVDRQTQQRRVCNRIKHCCFFVGETPLLQIGKSKCWAYWISHHLVHHLKHCLSSEYYQVLLVPKFSRYRNHSEDLRGGQQYQDKSENESFNDHSQIFFKIRTIKILSFMQQSVFSLKSFILQKLLDSAKHEVKIMSAVLWGHSLNPCLLYCFIEIMYRRFFLATAFLMWVGLEITQDMAPEAEDHCQSQIFTIFLVNQHNSSARYAITIWGNHLFLHMGNYNAWHMLA